MEITDRFDSERIKLNFIVQRSDLIWNRDDDGVRLYLESTEEYVNMYLAMRGIFTVYDLCITLKLKPQPIYAYMGWTKEDTIQIDSHISDSQVMLGITCKFL